jgi:hypothetical protein
MDRGAVRIFLAAAVAILLACPAWAASPAAGTVSSSSPAASWTGGPKLLSLLAVCGAPNNSQCDNYKLSIAPPSGSFRVEIVLTSQATDDYDLEVFDPSGQLVGSSGNGPGAAEKVVLNNPAGGIYTVSAAPFAAIRAYSATATLTLQSPPPPPPSDPPPTYALYAPPAGVGASAGEPTLGVNESTGAVMYIAGLETLKVEFQGTSATWTDVSAPQTSLITFDPILFTDQQTNRTFVSQLLPTKISLLAFTDDDGATWQPSMGAGINSGVDHQTVGGGPPAPGALLQPLTSYPHMVYYCSQDIALALCAASVDGGTTFGPAVPTWNLTQCGGLHGHIKVAPDGTVYVPNKSCGGEQGVAVSQDNGLNWTVRKVAGSSPGTSDPSVGVATDGTLYFGFVGSDGHAYVAVSHDEGQTWTNLQDVGAAHGIQNIVFPAVVAGDGDRAAFAFLGTTTAGNATGDDPNFAAVWHLYVAHTYDGGASWVTVNLTPGDPVQKSTICMSGTTCGGTRNLLDFMDATTDAEGRVLVSYADGCVGACVTGGANTFASEARIARQSSGKGLYSAFD